MEVENKTFIIKAENVIKGIIELVWGEKIELIPKPNKFGVSFIVSTNNQELKKSIIGKNGRNIKSIRKLLRIWSINNNFLVGVFVPSGGVVKK